MHQFIKCILSVVYYIIYISFNALGQPIKCVYSYKCVSLAQQAVYANRRYQGTLLYSRSAAVRGLHQARTKCMQYSSTYTQGRRTALMRPTKPKSPTRIPHASPCNLTGDQKRINNKIIRVRAHVSTYSCVHTDVPHGTW